MGVIFDIQRFSIHDGPGIRTILFLKGCSLRCPWCCNPESIGADFDVGFSAVNCIGCGKCLKSCQHDAIHDDENGRQIDRQKCRSCAEKSCVSACPAKAMELFGREISVSEAFRELERDKIFYDNSGGGVTFSGGESLLQAEFVADVAKLCRQNGITTAIETTCCCDWESILKVAPLIDCFLCDIKHVEKAAFEEVFGNKFELVMDNLEKLVGIHSNIIVRTPVIPGFNDDADSISAICEWMKKMRLPEIHLLPYHRLGMSKYQKLGIPYSMDPSLKTPEISKMEELCKIPQSYGLRVKNGG